MIFNEKKWPKFARFLRKKIPKLVDFYDKFQWVAKNIERFWVFYTFTSSMKPNLAKDSYG
jgi:hypothetical protein